MTVSAKRPAIAERRGATYWLLARLVLEAPTAAFLDALALALGGSPDDAGLPLAGEVAMLAAAAEEAQRSETAGMELLAEHTRLFGGLSQRYGPPPPYESVLLEDRLPGDATTAVAAAYAAAGLAPEVSAAGPADHLGNELRFMALCCASEAAAWRNADDADAMIWLERESAFLSQHLLRWVPDHARGVRDEARTAYHKAVGMLVAKVCRLDGDDVEAALESTVAELPQG